MNLGLLPKDFRKIFKYQISWKFVSESRVV